MISNPDYGWCDFELGGFSGTPSYVTDAPMDLLQAFEDYFYWDKDCVIVAFDEEGSEFYLVLAPYDVYVISQKEESELYHCEDKTTAELALELINDIESNITKWAEEFSLDIGEQYSDEHNNKIINERVKMFKEKIANIRKNI